MTGSEMLENWAAWTRRGVRDMYRKLDYSGFASVCGQYRSGYKHADDGDLDVVEIVDEQRALATDRAIITLPAQLQHAVIYFYTGKIPVNCIYRFHLMPENQLRELVDQAARVINQKTRS
jgi:hypothetical protein